MPLMLAGVVTLSSPDHIALITFSMFNVSVPRTEMPQDWRYDNEGFWMDRKGRKIEGEVEFEVTQYQLPFLSI